MTRIAGVLLVIALAAPAVPSIDSRQTPGRPGCDAPIWQSIGVDGFHCAGGACRFVPAEGTRRARFIFPVEPDLRRATSDALSTGMPQDGDALVAINAILITSPRGGETLANLPPDQDALLAVRRGEQILMLRVRPAPSCQVPLVQVGPDATSPGEGTLSAGDQGVPVLDFTTPRQVGPTATDLSLGLRVRCGGCALMLGGADLRGVVTDYPVVIDVVDGGVAAEAGLRPGDVIQSIDDRDVRSGTGRSPLFELPSLDFTVGYERNGRAGTAFMNRHIVDRRGLLSDPPPANGAWAVVVRGIQLRSSVALPVERTGDGSPPTLRFTVEPSVFWVAPQGAAERAGVEVGDVVTAADGQSVLTPAGASALLSPAPGRDLRLTVRRGERTVEVHVGQR